MEGADKTSILHSKCRLNIQETTIWSCPYFTGSFSPSPQENASNLMRSSGYRSTKLLDPLGGKILSKLHFKNNGEVIWDSKLHFNPPLNLWP